MNINHSLLKRMSVGDILDYTIEMYKRNFKQIIYCTLIFYGTYNIINTILTILWPTAAIFVSGFLSLIFSLTFQIVLKNSLIKIIYLDVVYNIKLKNSAIIKTGFKKYGHALLNTILVYLMGITIVVIVSFIIFYGIMLLLMALGFTVMTLGELQSDISNGLIFGSIFFVYIGAILLIALLMLYFKVKFGFGSQCIVIDNINGPEAIPRSFVLTRKNFFFVTFSTLFSYMFYYVFNTINSYIPMFWLKYDFSLLIIVYIVVDILLCLLFPFGIIASTLMFINLKIVNESFDFELKLDDLTKKLINTTNNNNMMG